MLLCIVFVFFFFKQKTAYEMRISDWSSDVCSSDLNIAVGYVRLKALPVMASKQTFGCVDPVIATSPMLERLNLCAGPSDMDLPRTPSFRLDGGRALVTGADRKSRVLGKSGAVRVDLGGRRIIIKKNIQSTTHRLRPQQSYDLL